MFRRILVPLDGSETAASILPQVRRILRRDGSEVILLRVWEPLTGRWISDEMKKDVPGKAEGYIEDIAAALERDGADARAIAREGNAAATILRVAADEEASLIAMSTHGRAGIARWAFGSVTEKVLRASTTPMLLMRSYQPGDNGDSRRVDASEREFRRLLVPLDGSEVSACIVPLAVEFATLFESGITLLHVLRDPDRESPSEEAQDALERAGEACEERGIPSTTRIWRPVRGEHPDAAVGILHVAEDASADLVAMATHGRSGVARWSFGSVAEKVLRASRTPMLITRSVVVANPA